MSDSDRFYDHFAPYVPAEAGGTMPASRDAIAASMARRLSAPPSENVEDRRHAYGWLTGPLAAANIPYDLWSLDPRNWVKPVTAIRPQPPSPLGDIAGYWDIGDERRPVDARRRGPR